MKPLPTLRTFLQEEGVQGIFSQGGFIHSLFHGLYGRRKSSLCRRFTGRSYYGLALHPAGAAAGS